MRNRILMATALVLALGVIAIALGLTPYGYSQSAKNELVSFVFQHKADPGSKGQFIARTDDPKVIASARAQLKLAEKERKLFISGALARGDGGYNKPWHWRIVDNNWKLAQWSMEVCDGRPQDLEDNISYWVDDVKRFCPYGGFVLREIPNERR